VLQLTDEAVEAIRALVPEGGGLRISAAPPPNGDDEPVYDVAVVTAPETADAVVECAGVHVFLEPAAIDAFEGKVLDAEQGEHGVSFTFLPTG
jgi:iron-sulfur cluster assembly protein